MLNFEELKKIYPMLTEENSRLLLSGERRCFT